MTEGMVLMPWWTPWLFGALMVGCIVASGWYDRYSKARLKEAMDYWERSKAVWDAIDAVPATEISDQGLTAMAAFMQGEVDQTGAIPTDYVASKPPA